PRPGGTGHLRDERRPSIWRGGQRGASKVCSSGLNARHGSGGVRTLLCPAADGPMSDEVEALRQEVRRLKAQVFTLEEEKEDLHRRYCVRLPGAGAHASEAAAVVDSHVMTEGGCDDGREPAVEDVRRRDCRGALPPGGEQP